MQFEIGNEQWNLYFIPPFSDIFLTSDGRRTVGVTDRSTNEVFIADNLTPEFEWKVLCHEIVHTAIKSYNIDLTIDQEELIADLIATYGDEILDVTDRIFSKLHRKYA